MMQQLLLPLAGLRAARECNLILLHCGRNLAQLHKLGEMLLDMFGLYAEQSH
jgi:hypothetical protein